MSECADCQAQLQGPYCSACGAKQLSSHDFGIGHFLGHALHDLTHFDTKVFGSLLPLLFKPGFLTAEFMAGHWKRYVKPTTLFILINVFFFFAKGGVMNWNARAYIQSAGPAAGVLVEKKAEERGQSLEQYEEHFTEIARERQHSMFFFAIPVLALGMLLFFPRRYLVEHLVYSVHYHAFLLLFLTIGLQVLFKGILVPLARIGVVPQLTQYLAHEPGLNYLVLAVAGLYQFVAIRRVYKVGWTRALATSALLNAGEFAYIVFIYQPLVFYWVYYTA
jgi:hypothetical protein